MNANNEVNYKDIHSTTAYSPWLSVIIPAHNCSKTIERLLDSIVIQDTENVEVIICDDQSTDDFLDKVVKYANTLTIKYLKTVDREIHCPGNTRLDGWKAAEGEWITFIDHDDMFEPNVFSTIKKTIIETGENKVITTTFRRYVYETDTYGIDFNGITWMHGKFYNRQWLINEKIDFKENLYTHEDLYFNGLVFSTLRRLNIGYTIIQDFYSYKWIYNEDSTSQKYDKLDHSFVESNFKDYIISASDPWFIAISKITDSEYKNLFFNQFCSIILYCYFYYQSFEYSEGDNKIKENIDMIKYLVYRVCFEFNKSKNDIITEIYKDPNTYTRIKNESFIGNCEFIEAISFKDFILNI